MGKSIRLVDFDTLVAPERFSTVSDERFDSDGFDEYKFDQSMNLPLVPEYVTINKSSQDKNPWTRYNRWFHEDVIKISAEANNIPLLLPTTGKAIRPIIEFESDLQLNNFGTYLKPSVQFIDTITKDVFSTVEGAVGYYIDGEEVGQGDRVIFTADNDNFVNNKTYIINFVKIGEKFRISLDEEEDVTPQLGDSVVITKGTTKKGENWWYNGTTWTQGQQKTALNQAPRFEIFDNDGVAYSDVKYKNIFLGSKIFGYSVGTGTADPALGFPLKYKNIENQAYYLFENYFMNDINFIIDGNNSYSVPVANGFVKKILSKNESTYSNVWAEATTYQIPILQYSIVEEPITELEITAVQNPGYQSLDVDVYVNDIKQVLIDDYTLFASGRRFFIIFKNELPVGNRVLLKIKSEALPSDTGAYEISLGYSNNPLNGPIGEFTLSELSDHVKTMVDRHPDFSGAFPGTSNIRDLDNLSSYGTRLISNKNPLAFAAYFIANDEYNLITATKTVAKHYNQFKLGLIEQITQLKGNYTSAQALDIALFNMNTNKDISFPYAMSDMIAYGTDVVTRNFTVTDRRNKEYSLTSIFSLDSLSERSVLIYHTDTQGTITQLLHGSQYTFDLYDSSVYIKIDLEKGDTITVSDYPRTRGNYVPPTPTKLGLYPKYEPKIFVDDTYADSPQTMIQGHDGSLILSFGDYRDDIILEFERRVFNNIKVNYNPDLLDINSILPGAFRSNKYNLKEVNDILSREFLKWDSFYGFNYSNNSTSSENRKTWNFSSGQETVTNLPLPGNWRGIYKYFFDTDRPHTHPWEMLGFPIMPEWWIEVYGPAPYTRGNEILWKDIETGTVRDPAGIKINSRYIRSGLSKILPVDNSGNLLDPAAANIATALDYNSISNNWKFGDQGPVEAAWRKSSFWPFAVQILMALTDPATYSSLLFDTSRISKNLAGQFGYGDNKEFLSFDILSLYQDTISDLDKVMASGYSVFLIEAGRQKNKNYLSNLKDQINYITFKLAHKLGGFINKEKFKIIVDSVNPNSANAGVTLVDEDHSVFLDKSSPIKSLGVSGVIVEKTERGFSIRGYDTNAPYFNCLMPIFSSTDPSVHIGGKNESYVDWTESASNPMSGLDTTSVSTNDGYRFYKQGQVVRYLGKFYRVKVSHNSGTTFNSANFQPLPSLPVIGGVSVRRPSKYETSVAQISYGVEYTDVEELYAVLVGYGRWLENQGCIFDEYNKDLTEILNWTYSAKEFLFWTTQKWTAGSVITLSPFANRLKFSDSSGVVDSLTNAFYEYSVLKADGGVLSSKSISTSRDENIFVIKTQNTTDGIFFVRLNLIQKEHTLVLNNQSLFNDVIYDIESGYRQRRLKLSGFITDNWNGDLFSPGFIYDEANINSWESFTDYSTGDVVFYAGNYYSANNKVLGSEKFNFDSWTVLGSRPVAELLPNFDYKIDQFQDFYSLDIDNFDLSQQKLAQHLIGYSPRTYLDNIFTNATSQYKFYQGYIKEKGTKNTINKLSKASLISQGGYVEYYEDWAFRVGDYGSFSTNQTLEVILNELKFRENPQVVKFVETEPIVVDDFISYETSKNIVTKPDGYNNYPFATTSSLFLDSVSVLPHAGYVRLDDVTATAFNDDSLLDIANNRGLKDGDTVWVGFKSNGDWGVYRYTQIPSRVADVEIYVPGTSLLLTTDYYHNLSVGDIISISQFDSQIDGVYTVNSVPELNQIIVSALLTDLTTPFSPAIGLIFKFVSSRFDNIDDISNLITIEKFQFGEKLWIDDTDGKWTVYQKNKNFSASAISAPYYSKVLSSNQQFGHTVSGNSLGTKIITSSPNFIDSNGKVFAYRKNGTGTDSLFLVSTIDPNPSNVLSYYSTATMANFGASLAFDNDNDYIFIGAPNASNVKHTLVSNKFSTVSLIGSSSGLSNQGLVKLQRVDFDRAEDVHELVIASPQPQANAEFGYDIFVGNISTSSKVLFVSSPGQNNKVGAVHHSIFNITSATGITNQTSAVTNGLLPLPSLTPDSKFGHSIAGNYEATRIAVSAPGYFTSTGAVYVYTSVNRDVYTLAQTISPFNTDISSIIESNSGFGEKVVMDSTGEYLYISVPKTSLNSTRFGKILVFKYDQNSTSFKFDQTIENPYSNNGYDFGSEMAISPNGKTLIVSSLGSSHRPYVSFDTYVSQTVENRYVLDPTSDFRESNTTFDSDTTKFYSVTKNSGSSFAFTRENTKFIFGEELYDQIADVGNLYGNSLFASDSFIAIGAPGLEEISSQVGSLYLYDSLTSSLNSWAVHRQEEELIDLEKIKHIRTIDTEKEEVIDYLEVIDPIKGKISGFADQELTYKSLFDPAIYSIGVSGVVTNTNANWLDEHVGELWWDLSSVKYVWYEQGDLEFRRNNWNTIFPGSMIDVYEWVRTPYLPSQWSVIADTNEGLIQGISGQPKFVDNSVVSVKQVWDPISNSFSNLYFYWVKNKTTIPTGTTREYSAYNVASLIANPKAQGIKFASIIANNAVMLTNMQSSIIGTKINLSIDIDTDGNGINKHTEWLLLQDGNESSVPNTMLVRKTIDSLLGKDSLGNTVPDPTLSDRNKYGINFRPRQSMFKNRTGALRTLIEYSNSILKKNNIVDSVNLEKFNSKDEIPNSILGEYDVAVEDIIERDFSIITRNLKRGYLSCTVTNGKIATVSIDNPGFGYGTQDLKSVASNVDSKNYIGPTVIVEGNGIEAIIETEVNIVGEIVKVVIKNPGSGFTEPPILTVRPFTVLVNTDETVNGKWSKYVWNYDLKSFSRSYTQAYNTPDFWNYIDWIDSTYNDAQDIISTINSPYQLAYISGIPAGGYVKIRNGGDGRYIVIRKISSDQLIGTYNDSYDLIYQEKGTIQISTAIWNYQDSVYGWDQVSGWDQTSFDQQPAKETEKIIYGLLEDVFVGPLKVYYNKLFFKLVKYAFTEQKFLDWAFKTSFIDVYNRAGALDQRPVYKLNNESYYQDYINETKPYHTKVRNFTNNYTATDVTQSVITDFDLPSVYSASQGKFVPVTFGRPELTKYPWKSWFQNYTYSVESIEVYDGGLGYDIPPIVEIVPQVGDLTGTGAKAIAYIALGKVSKIIVTDPGSGYIATPIVNLIGGGPTDLTKARTSIRMSNNQIRSNKITMKFDRVSGYNEITTSTAYDSFVASGSTREFKLTWSPNPDKNNITVKVNGIRKLSGNYSIEKYTEKYNGYTKQYGTLVLDTIPAKLATVTIEYLKDHSLYHAVDRIRDYYSPTSGMPGNTSTMLMNGLEYPGVTIDTLPFEVSKGWDTLPFGESNWDDYTPEIGAYETKGNRITATVAASTSLSASTLFYFNIVANQDVVNVKTSATYTVGVTTYVVTTSTIDPADLTQWQVGLSPAVSVGVGSNIVFDNPNPTRYSLPFVPSNTTTLNVYVNGERISGYTSPTTFTNVISLVNGRGTGNNYINVIDVGTITNSTSVVTIRPETSDGSAPVVDLDLDTYIRGGYFEVVNGKYQPTKSDDYEDINIDGDEFVSPTNSYGPEENVPGRVSDSLGINVYTYPKAGSALMVNKKYIRDPNYETRYPIGFTLPSTNSVEVMLDNQKLTYGTDYTIDFPTNEIVMLEDANLAIKGPYFSSSDVLPRKQGTVIASTAGDDTYTGPYPLGFEWNMFGTKYTTVYVGTNGYLTFGGGDSSWTPLNLGQLLYPAIYIEYCDLWQAYGTSNNNTTPLSTGETPGLFLSNGTVGNFIYWRLRFQGTHYNKRGSVPSVPAYQYEVTLYSDGTNQYIEMIYENTWREANFNGDFGFITGVALARSGSTLGTGILVDDALIENNTSHVFYSTSNGGDWKYAGRGSFDPFKNQDLPLQVLSITSTSVGGKNLIETNSTTINYITGQKVFEYASKYSDVNSAYITVNGIKRSDYTLSGTNGTNGRLKLTFANNLNIGDILQVWFFAANHKAFSEIKEQVISASSGTRSFTLSEPPANIKPLHGQVIVEQNNTRLSPPDTLYYSASNGTRRFSLDNHYDYPQGLPDMEKLEVYVNGVRTPFGETLRLIQDENIIEFDQLALSNTDVVAITLLRDHDYYIDGSKLILTNRVSVANSSTIKVTTFTNHDNSLFRRERFPGNFSRVFRLSRNVLNSNYLWVELNGRLLTRDTEYRLELDKRTVILNESFTLTSEDTIVIMSVVDQTSESLIGYRIFHDNLGRTHYKRLSQQNSTQLAADLLPTDTEMTVEDASVLTVPDVSKYRPGVILIDGERIEFFNVEGNKLTSLRRGTLGTGVKSLHKEGSVVVDQGAIQNIPLAEYKQIDKFKINSTTTTLLTLTNVTFTSTTVEAYNRIEVVYQGRPLRKPLSNTYKSTWVSGDRVKVTKNTTSTYQMTDRSIAYDSNEISSTGSVSTYSLDPEFTINTTTNVITLAFAPRVGAEINVIKSVSQQVGIEYSDVHSKDIEQVKFLLDRPSFLPDKYYYGQNTTTDQYLVLETGDTLDSETGDPLIGQ